MKKSLEHIANGLLYVLACLAAFPLYLFINMVSLTMQIMKKWHGKKTGVVATNITNLDESEMRQDLRRTRWMNEQKEWRRVQEIMDSLENRSTEKLIEWRGRDYLGQPYRQAIDGLLSERGIRE